MKPISPTNSNARCHQSPMAIVGAILAFGVIRLQSKDPIDKPAKSSHDVVLAGRATPGSPQNGLGRKPKSIQVHNDGAAQRDSGIDTRIPL